MMLFAQMICGFAQMECAEKLSKASKRVKRSANPYFNVY